MKKSFHYSILCILLLLLCSPVSAQDSNFKIGIALRGGGALGFAHIGALGVIDSLEIPIDYVAGTSMGGLIGALYSMGWSAREMEEFVMNVDWADIFNDAPSRDYLPYLIKRKSGKYQLELDIDGYSPALPSGLIAGQKIYKLFFENTYIYEGIKSFDNLPIPYRCVGADLVTGNEIIFNSGSLAKAMRATMSIPTAFDPVKYADSLVIDGGMKNNFPVDVTKKMGADFVIGLNLVSQQRNAEYYDDLLKILDRTLDVPRQDKLVQTIELADLLIQQNIAPYSLTSFDSLSIRQIILRGKQAAYAVIEELIDLQKRAPVEVLPFEQIEIKLITHIEIQGSSRFSLPRIEKILHIKTGKLFSQELLNKRIKRFNQATHLAKIDVEVIEDATLAVKLLVKVSENNIPIVRDISITGNRAISKSFILSFLGLKPGERYHLAEFQDRIALLYGLDYFKDIKYTMIQNRDDSVSLTIEIIEKSPYKFVFGFHYNDFLKLVGTIGFRLNHIAIPGLFIDSELQFSGLTRFKTDIFYPTRSIDYPIYPLISFGYQDIPREVYDTSGVKVLKFSEQGWFLAAGLGLSPMRYLNFEGKIALEYPNILIDIGDVEEENRQIKDKILAFIGDINVDLLDNVLVPRNGIKLFSNLEMSFKDFGSSFDYTRSASFVDYYHTIARTHTFRLNSWFLKSWGEDPFYKTLFFIAGPHKFFGLAYSQGMGTEFFLLRLDYRYEFVSNLFLKGIINTSPHYQLGIAGDEQTGSALWGYGFGVMYNSILGPIELQFAWGDKTPYNPGEKTSRVYFIAGYKLGNIF
jgi:predicted acylesterase/phospholipase RssA